MTSLTLRKASTEDSEFAYRVRRVAFEQYVEKASGWDDGEQRQLHDQRFRMQDFRVINLAEARQLGLPVRLRVMKVNPRALAFYEGLEFMRVGETETHDLMEWTHDLALGRLIPPRT